MMMKRLLQHLLVLMLAAFAFGASGAQPAARQPAAAQPPAAPQGAAAPGAAAQQPEWRLGSGDEIRVVVFQNPDLTQETRVSENGAITYPLVGTVQVGGLTIPAAEKAVSKALSDGGFIKNAQVSIQLLRNRGNQVSVLGYVGRPGRYPLETLNTKLSEMIAIAGGIGAAGADVAIVTGTRDGKPFRKEIDVTSMFLKDPQDDIKVAGGDEIYVHRQPIYYIYGEVRRPGSYRVERNMTIRQALAMSGGLTPRGTERKIDIYRGDGSGKVAMIKPELDNFIQPDDVVYVGESWF